MIVVALCVSCVLNLVCMLAALVAWIRVADVADERDRWRRSAESQFGQHSRETIRQRGLANHYRARCRKLRRELWELRRRGGAS